MDQGNIMDTAIGFLWLGSLIVGLILAPIGIIYGLLRKDYSNKTLIILLVATISLLVESILISSPSIIFGIIIGIIFIYCLFKSGYFKSL